jgi:hypothetical protein
MPFAMLEPKRWDYDSVLMVDGVWTLAAFHRRESKTRLEKF